jgi:hypothetical protein
MMAMNISFPSCAPEYCAPDLALEFPAFVDDHLIECSITAEALEDHFGARSSREEDLVDAFIAHRAEIVLAAQRLLNEVGGKPIILHRGYFRFCN